MSVRVMQPLSCFCSCAIAVCCAITILESSRMDFAWALTIPMAAMFSATVNCCVRPDLLAKSKACTHMSPLLAGVVDPSGAGRWLTGPDTSVCTAAEAACWRCDVDRSSLCC